MGLFSFLENTAKTVGHDVATVARGNSQPGGGAFGFLNKQLLPQNNQQKLNQPNPINAVAHAVQQIPVIGRADTHILNAGRDIAQGTIGAGIPIGTEIYNKTIAPAFNLPQQTFHPSQFGSVGMTLLGKNDILSPTQTYSASRQAGHGIPFSFLLGTAVAAGATPVGGASGDVAKSLIKASTTEEALKLLTKNGVAPDIATKIAPAIAQTKDPITIRNLIDKAHSPALPSAAPEIPVTPVGQTAPVGAGQGVSEAPNKFLQTVNNAQSTTQELKDAITGLQQTHELRNTEELSNKALANVQKDFTSTLTQVLSTKNPTDEEVAMGEHIITQAQQSGQTGIAVNVAEHLDTTLREHGRAIQAASIMSRLSPEGRLLTATRKVAKAREANPKSGQEIQTAQDIKKSVEDTELVGKSDISNVLKQISNDQQKLDLGGVEGANQAVENTGQKLAKNVERAASPQVQKKADTLVQELTKKVKQEYLEPKTTIKKSPLSILQEVFARNAEAQDAYPLAQKILRDKYAAVPQMQEALDKFFGSKLDLPAAKSTVGNAIRDQLAANSTKISEIMYKSIGEQRTTVEQIAGDLTKEGFDPQSASTLANEVARRLGGQITDAKKAVLERLSKDSEGKAQATFLEKLNKLSNLGALSDHDYLNLARAKLNLPHLNETDAARIHDLSQQIQSMQPGADQYKLIRELHDTINSNIPLSKGEKFRQIFAAPRSVKASVDVSGLGRQGEILGTRFPAEWKDAWGDSLKAFGSQKFYDNKVADLQTGSSIPEHLRAEYLALREKAGVAIVGGPDALHEEAFASTLPEKVPGAGQAIEASDRAYTLGLSSLRDRAFENIFNKYQNIKPMSSWTDEEVKSIGRFINTASGRGDLGSFLETHGKTLQEALFSPKLWKSRIDTINPYYYYQLKGPARKYAAEAGATFAGTTATIMGLAVAAGAKVDTDPRSSDFLKIKVGDTRFDIMGGLQQNLVFLWRELSGQKKSSQTGKITALDSGGFGAANRLSILSDLFQSKENPSLAEITKQIKGQDQSGNKLTPGGRLKSLGQLGVPLSLGDTYNNITHSQSVGGGLLKSIPGFVGVGVNSYGIQDINVTGKQKEYLDKLQKQGVDSSTISANKQFFQILKSAPNSQPAMDRIHKAIDAGDYQKAVAISMEYNAALDQYIHGTGWVQKNEKYISPVLEKQYESAKINVTSASIKSYLNSKKGL